MICDQCGSSDQVVTTQDGKFCRNCYRGYKRGKAVGRVVTTVECESCGTLTEPGRPCFMCGQHLDSKGGVLRIGGGPNC